MWLPWLNDGLFLNKCLIVSHKFKNYTNLSRQCFLLVALCAAHKTWYVCLICEQLMVGVHSWWMLYSCRNAFDLQTPTWMEEFLYFPCWWKFHFCSQLRYANFGGKLPPFLASTRTLFLTGGIPSVIFNVEKCLLSSLLFCAEALLSYFLGRGWTISAEPFLSFVYDGNTLI